MDEARFDNVLLSVYQSQSLLDDLSAQQRKMLLEILTTHVMVNNPEMMIRTVERLKELWPDEDTLERSNPDG